MEDRKFEAISAAVELNEYINQFIISVRPKDGTEYEPTSLRRFNCQLQETRIDKPNALAAFTSEEFKALSRQGVVRYVTMFATDATES